MKYFEYKHYLGSCNASIEELKKEFELAVDDYLIHCKKIGKSPDKTFKGSFNVRIGYELHQKTTNKAENMGKSLNDYIKDVVIRDTEPHA